MSNLKCVFSFTNTREGGRTLMSKAQGILSPSALGVAQRLSAHLILRAVAKCRRLRLNVRSFCSVLATALLAVPMVGCRSESNVLEDNQRHACIGLNQTPDSTLVYEYSARNIGLAILFSEIVVPPVVVALNEYKCPVAAKATK